MNNNEYRKVIDNAVAYINGKITEKPQIALILGSGLGDFADLLTEKIEIPYAELEGFPVSTVKGHAGKFVFGKLNGKNVVCMKGRFHLYEGYASKQTVLPIYVLKMLGIETLIVTNAAGGVNKEYDAGDLMVINDHINMSGHNPLIGGNLIDFGEQFIDMSNDYNKDYIKLLNDIAEKNGIKVQNGVYVQLTGPSYETAAEIRAYRTLGIDSVGMSTVQEVIAANQCKLKVAGVTCITNMATGVKPNTILDHKEVVEVANRVKASFTKLIAEFIREC
ncbi:MAG: purine-nucleoside phosphorylase [Clostridia bacterium]|nr:purine-nucleoside phosphorylase [Clostridia bacterium]